MSNRLILGTAAFGSDYGIKRDGQPSIQEIEEIAQVAWDGGIRVIHTSWQYGLPEGCDKIFKGFDRIRKLQSCPDIFVIETSNNHTLTHGICCYDKTKESIDFDFPITILQIPLNILDNRWLGKEFIKQCQLHARSVFLQGLLLMEVLPTWLSMEARTMIKTFQSVCKAQGLQYYEGALGWVLGLDNIDGIIVGVNSAKQLEELLAVKPLKWEYDFSIQDENILDPRRWPK